jgi:hypothetical protein
MKIQELRQLILNYPKFPGTEKVNPAKVCHIGFPGDFNLSFTEAEVLKAFGDYINYDRDFIYSKIQPVIRTNDFINRIESQAEESYGYAGVFDMADISSAILLMDSTKKKELAQFSIDSTFNFLIKTLGLEMSKLRVSYFKGGNIKNATDGKYTFDYKIPLDKSITFWQRNGLLKNQLIPDSSRTTLLALNVYGLPTPWGYRQEVLYEHKGKLLDIATVENLMYAPVFRDNKIVDLKELNHSVSLTVTGLERLLVCINNLDHITDCDNIKGLKEAIIEKAQVKDEGISISLCEGLRVIHRIIADCGQYQDLSKKRKRKIKIYYKSIIKNFKRLEIELNSINLFYFFSLNAKLANYYPELLEVVEIATKEIIAADRRFKEDKSLKHKGV